MASERSPLRRLVLPVLLVILAGLAGGYWWMAIGRFPFAGDTHHDFGEVPLVGRTAAFHHEFVLRNRRGRDLTVTIHPSCGCTDVNTKPQTVEAKGELRIPVTLNLAKPGKKSSRLMLHVEGEPIQTLWLYATAMKSAALQMNGGIARVRPGETTSVLFELDVQANDDEPAPPTLVAPEGVEATFDGWTRTREREGANPARWCGKATIALAADVTLPLDAQLEVMAGGEHDVIRIAQLPANSPPPTESPAGSPPDDR